MGSLNDLTTDLITYKDVSSDWTSDLPFQDLSALDQENLNSFLNRSYYHLNCPSAGPNNLGRYISMVLYFVVCVIGLFGNSLVI